MCANPMTNYKKQLTAVLGNKGFSNLQYYIVSLHDQILMSLNNIQNN